MHYSASRAVVRRLAPGIAPDPSAHSRATATVLENPEPGCTALTRQQFHPASVRGCGADCHIAHRVNRRLKAATAELERMDQAQSERMHHQLNRALQELSRLAMTIPREERSGKEPYAESTATNGDSGTACPGSEETGDRSRAGNLSPERTQSRSFQLDRSASVSAAGESRTL